MYACCIENYLTGDKGEIRTHDVDLFAKCHSSHDFFKLLGVNMDATHCFCTNKCGWIMVLPMG